MPRRIELEVLATVDRDDTISELATKLDHSESYLSRGVGDLVEKRLVYTERDGRRKRVVPSDARAVELYQDLVRQHSHIDFPELLTGKALEVLYYLDKPRTVAEIADRSDNYRNTVNRVLKRFRDRGLVGTADGHYEFNADFDRLHKFARQLTHHLHRHRLEAVASKGTILWEDYDEFLAQTETEIDPDEFHETGLARFAAFGLQFLLTSHRYYFYSEEPNALTLAEFCFHTLLIDDSSRYRSYCLLLLSHVDVDEDDLSFTDLSGATLRDADLSDANLQEANLSDSILRNAELGLADLENAALSGADLRDLVLTSGMPTSPALTSRMPTSRVLTSRMLTSRMPPSRVQDSVVLPSRMPPSQARVSR